MRSKGFRSGDEKGCKRVAGLGQGGTDMLEKLATRRLLSIVGPAHRGGRTLWLLGSQHTG